MSVVGKNDTLIQIHHCNHDRHVCCLTWPKLLQNIARSTGNAREKEKQ